MARTCKKGIDYFSHDTSMSNDFKVKMIQAKHGIEAYAIYNKLLERIYDENGYWLHLSEDVNILFCNDNIIAIDVYILVVNECINYELFNKKLYDKYSILTSARIQKNYCEAVKRRKQVDFVSEYLLLKLDDVHMNDLNVNILTLNADIGTQKKVKEIKVNKKESKTKDRAFALEYISRNNIDWITAKMWEEWIDHKIKQKTKITDRALGGNIAKLKKVPDPNAAIVEACDRNWKDMVVPDAPTSNPKGNRGQHGLAGLEAWGHVMAKLSNPAVELTDLEKKAVQSMGGWLSLKGKSYQQLDFNKRDFVKHFENEKGKG